MEFKETNYHRLYDLYKKIPKIIAIVLAILVFIWSIVDVSVFSDSYSGRYYSYAYYGVMRLDSPVLAVFIWWVIGAVMSLGTWFFGSLAIAPIVIQTDTLIEMNMKMKKD